MRSHSLLHDTAWQTAAAVIRSLPGLSDEQRCGLYPAVYAAVRKGLDHYADRAEYMARRMGGVA